MIRKTFIRTILIFTIIVASVVLYSARTNATAKPSEDCPAASEKCDDNKAQGEMMIWESVSRHLLANN